MMLRSVRVRYATMRAQLDRMDHTSTRSCLCRTMLRTVSSRLLVGVLAGLGPPLALQPDAKQPWKHLKLSHPDPTRTPPFLLAEAPAASRAGGEVAGCEERGCSKSNRSD